jgi:hypothetical protein
MEVPFLCELTYYVLFKVEGSLGGVVWETVIEKEGKIVGSRNYRLSWHECSFIHCEAEYYMDVIDQYHNLAAFINRAY